MAARDAYVSTRVLAYISIGTIAVTAQTAFALGVVGFVSPEIEAQLARHGLDGGVEVLITVLALIWFLTLIPSAVVFLLWFYEVTRNAQIMSTGPMRTTPRMAVVSWLIPLLQLFRPYSITRTIYRKSRPRHALRGDWVQRFPVLLPAWWWAWLFGHFTGGFRGKNWEATQGERLASLWDVSAGIADVIGGVCVAAVIWSIEVRQEDRARFGPPSDEDAGEEDEEDEEDAEVQTRIAE